MMDRVLLLVPTRSYRAEAFLAGAAKLGVAVTVGSNQQHVLADSTNGATLAVDFTQPDRSAARIAAWAERYPLKAIVPTDDETVVLAATAAQALGLRHNPRAAVATTRNKYLWRARLAEAGVPSPDFSCVALDQDPWDVARAARYPCVLKPLDRAGSQGVIRADHPTAFVAAFHRISRILRPAASRRDTASEILVEDYIPGREVALDGLLSGGRLQILALFDKPDPLAGPYFEETIYVTPSRLPASLQHEIAETMTRSCAALGLWDGPVHAELRINARGIWPIEVAARSIGGLCGRSLRFGAGIALEELILRHALGLPRAVCEREKSAAGVMMIPIPRGGRLLGVAGLEAARALPHIEDVVITVPIGDLVVPLPEGDCYLGFIFARADDPDTAEAALRAAHQKLTVTIDSHGWRPGGAIPPRLPSMFARNYDGSRQGPH